MASDEQMAWVGLAESLRAGLSALAGDLPAMTPTEAKALVDAAQAAINLHQQAADWDRDMRPAAVGFRVPAGNGDEL